MTKQVSLYIDRASWTNAPAQFRHATPATFPTGNVTAVDFLASLLQLGTLTVPWRGAACSLAAYWAYVRYCAAIDTASPSLRLKEEWFDLDSHQKTILSDDWGVGFTTHWLASRLCFQSYCDGRYFIEQLDGLGLAAVNRPPEKRGPYKSPDFIFEDDQGRFHIVECKGNQQSSSVLRSQVQDGIVQKRNIIFADEQAQVGQRIVAGLFIADSESNQPSLLAFADPEPDDRLSVKIREDASPAAVRDIVHRGDVAREFQVLGAPAIAHELLARPAEIAGTQVDRRQALSRAVSEFANRSERHPETGLVARTINMPFPEPITFGGGRFRSVRVEHSVKEAFLEQLAQYDPSQHTLAGQFPEAELSELGWSTSEGEHSASIHRGARFVSEISLLE